MRWEGEGERGKKEPTRVAKDGGQRACSEAEWLPVSRDRLPRSCPALAHRGLCDSQACPVNQNGDCPRHRGFVHSLGYRMEPPGLFCFFTWDVYPPLEGSQSKGDSNLGITNMDLAGFRGKLWITNSPLSLHREDFSGWNCKHHHL